MPENGSCSGRPTLDATGIGEYVHFEGCPRYFKLRFEGDKEKNRRAWREAFRPISPLLYGAGECFEERTWKELREKALYHHDLEKIET